MAMLGDARRADQPPVEPTRDVAATTASRALPTGTVTFLRTDVEGSMRLARALGRRGTRSTRAHGHHPARGRRPRRHLRADRGRRGLRGLPRGRRGGRGGDRRQRALAAHQWPDGADLRVRMGLHSGEAHLAGDDYGGFEVNRAARIAAAGHGGQIVLVRGDPSARRGRAAGRRGCPRPRPARSP